jgi:hypothetical protein
MNMKDVSHIRFVDGGTSTAADIAPLLLSFFADGTIPEVDGATHYFVDYGELYACSDTEMLGVWSEEVPDRAIDMSPHYELGGGEWETEL